MEMFLPDQEKRKDNDKSMMRTKIGGYRIDCQKVAELSMLLRPKARKSTLGEALTRELTMPFRKPAGDLNQDVELVLILFVKYL